MTIELAVIRDSRPFLIKRVYCIAAGRAAKALECWQQSALQAR